VLRWIRRIDGYWGRAPADRRRAIAAQMRLAEVFAGSGLEVNPALADAGVVRLEGFA